MIYILAGIVFAVIGWRLATDKSEWGPVRARILILSGIGILVTRLVNAFRR
ncbi:MAG TPA: hypothetical protein VF972_04415 [Actinomycetota bacterium]